MTSSAHRARGIGSLSMVLPGPLFGAVAGVLVSAVVGALLALTACQLPYTGGARTVHPDELGDGWYRAAATPIIRQHHETDCGLAALAMVAGTWGRRWSVADLGRALPPTERGVRLGALRDLARARGLLAYAIEGSVQDLEHELSLGRPVVLGLMLPFDRGHNASHYEVAVAMNPRDGAVVTIDPASGQWRQRTKQVLDLAWRSAGFAALVVVGGSPGRGLVRLAHHAGAIPELGVALASRLRASVTGAWPSPSSTTRR